MTAFLKVILQVGIFMVCAQTIVHFKPNGSYEKYLKILVSLMILIQIFRPILSLVGRSGESLEERIGFFQGQMWDGMEQAGDIAERADQILNQMSLEEIRERLETERRTSAGEDTDSGPGDGTGNQKKAGDSPGEEIGARKMDEESRDEESLRQSTVQIEKIQVELGTEAEKRAETE